MEIYHRFSNSVLRKGMMPPHQGSFIKRKTFLEFGGFNEIYQSSADFEMFCRMKKSGGRTIETDKIITNVSAGGLSSEKGISYPETARIISEFYGFIPVVLFQVRKIIIEQGIKRILNYFGLGDLSLKLARYKNQKSIKIEHL